MRRRSPGAVRIITAGERGTARRPRVNARDAQAFAELTSRACPHADMPAAPALRPDRGPVRRRGVHGLPSVSAPARILGAVTADAPRPSIEHDAVAAAPTTLDGFLAAIGTRAYRFAEIGLRHREDALDAVQDAMIKMLNYQERPPVEWTPLFWSILRSRIIDTQRRRTFRLGWLTSPGATEDATLDWADHDPDPSRAHDNRESYTELASALRDLPARQREAFTLRILEELDVATTASVMRCSEGSVKTHLSRARAALQKRLEDFA